MDYLKVKEEYENIENRFNLSINKDELTTCNICGQNYYKSIELQDLYTNGDTCAKCILEIKREFEKQKIEKEKIEKPVETKIKQEFKQKDLFFSLDELPSEYENY
jgi:hypothetical protein